MVWIRVKRVDERDEEEFRQKLVHFARYAQYAAKKAAKYLKFSPEEQRYFEDPSIMYENANIPPSVGALVERTHEQLFRKHIYEPQLRAYARYAYTLIKSRKLKDFKAPYSIRRIYCGAVDLLIIPRAGFETEYTKSTPPKHLDSVVDQITRLAISLSFEREGAVGINLIDAALAPYLRYDARLTPYRYLKLLYEKLGRELPQEVLEYAKAVEAEAIFDMTVQQCQRLIFTLCNTERPTIQTPFTNGSFLVTCSPKLLARVPVYFAGRQVGVAADYVDEMKTVLKAFCILYYRGDAEGKSFTFPIPTVYNANDSLFKLLDSDPDLWFLFWRTVATRGTFYFQNLYYKGKWVEDRLVALAFCCRLVIDVERLDLETLREILKIPHGTWSLPGMTGSVVYAGIKLTDIALRARDDSEFFEMLLDRLHAAREYINFVRINVEKLYAMGMYPATRYVARASGLPEDINIFRLFYYNTYALFAADVAFSIWFLKFNDDYDRELEHERKYVPEKLFFKTVFRYEDAKIIREYIKFKEKILSFIHEVLAEFEREDECLSNLEQAPAESAGYVYAQADVQMFGKQIEEYVPRYVDPETGKIEYFYVSQITPPYCTWSLKTQIFVESLLQPLYSGGVTKLLYLTEPFYDECWSRREQEEALERLAKFVREVLNTEPEQGRRIIYFAPTPTVNHCRSCHYVWVGNPYRNTDESGLPRCPRCGSDKVESWSRPVGYYRPVRNWNPGRRAEFMLRLEAAKYLKL